LGVTKGMTRMWSKRFTSAVATFALLATCQMLGASDEVKLQRAVPFGILNRVFPIKFNQHEGTCFVVDLDDRQYIISARHLFREIKPGDPVQLFIDLRWITLKVTPIFPESEKTDIVALAADQLVAPKMEVLTGDEGIYVGQDVYFLGFPFNLATRFDQPVAIHLAFIKKAVLSAIDARPESGHILYLDGHNNPGFSGGPVIFANYDQRDRLQTAGVIAGYRQQPTEVVTAEVKEAADTSDKKGKRRTVQFVRENTGIVVAYAFSEIRKAIQLKPLGKPLAKESQ